MPQRRRKRSRVGGGDGNNIAVDDDDVTQPSESDELEDGSNSDGDEILEDEEGDTDDPLNVTVETVQNPTTEDDETGGEDAVDSTGEDRGDDKTHWRGMVWDPEKNCFNYYPCEDDIGGDAEQRKQKLPYTFDQKNVGKRELIATKYGRSVFTAFGRWKNRLVKFLEYRDGRGNVSLAMNSDCSEDDPQVVEFDFKNGAADRWYKDESLTDTQRKLKAFQGIEDAEVSAEDKRNIDFHLNNLKVLMLTCSDLDVSWFLQRMFSFTSSSSYAALKQSASFLPTDFPQQSAFTNVLGYANLDRQMNTDGPDDMSVERDDRLEPINAQLVSKTMKSMRRPNQATLIECANEAKRIGEALMTDKISVPILREMLIVLGFSRQRVTSQLAITDAKKHLRKWIKSITDLHKSTTTLRPNDDNNSSSSASLSSDDSDEQIDYNFPYEFLSSNEIDALLKKRIGDDVVRRGEVPGPHTKPKNTSQQIESLRYIDANQSVPLSARERGDDHNPLRDSILSGAIRKAFLQPQDKNEKAASRLGHQNEPHYLLMIIGKSCYHFAHQTLFCQDTREQDDDQSSSLARLNTPTRLP